MTRWGGQVDVISMSVWAAFLVAYAAARWRDLARGGFLALSLVLATGLSTSKLTLPISSDAIFGGVLAASALLEGAALQSQPDRTTDKRWLLGAVVLFGLALAIWLPSRTPSGALCWPDSPFQGHAAWHLLCAGATACVYRYACSEDAVADRP